MLNLIAMLRYINYTQCREVSTHKRQEQKEGAGKFLHTRGCVVACGVERLIEKS